MRRIAVITGSRADHSPLRNTIRLLGDNCIHIQTEGLYGHESFIKESLQREKPDFVLLLGDRFETLVAAGVAALLTIPIVHIHGGEITEGAVDDAFRHAISKLSYYHFVAHQKYKGRLERMGEAPERIYVTGAPGVDDIERLYGTPNLSYVLVSLHSETLGNNKENLATVEELINGRPSIWTATNLDIGWQDLPQTASFNREAWLNAMYNADVLIGNSSGFIFEGMTMGKKVIMVGERQKGRYDDAVTFFKRDAHAFGLPGQVSPRIVELLMTLPIPNKPRKEFNE